MRNTFFYFDFSQLTEEQLAAYQEAVNGGSISIDFTAPAAYSGSVPSIEAQNLISNPTATDINETPQYAGYADTPFIAATVNDQGQITEYDQCLLRVEQHPSIYGIPLRIKLRSQLSNGTVPQDSQIISSQPVFSNEEIVVELAFLMSETSVIQQADLLNTINNLQYNNDYLAIASIACTSNGQVVAVKDSQTYDSDGLSYHHLSTHPLDILTTAGDPSILNVSGDPLISGVPEQGRLLSISLIEVRDIDTSLPVSYQWFREVQQDGVWTNVAISNAESNFYTVKSTDVDKNITAGILYISTAGEITQKFSAPIRIINSLPTAEITIATSTYEVGNVITSDVQNLSDSNYVDRIELYQWQRSQDKPLILRNAWQPVFTDISGANASSYQITTSDEGAEIRLKIEVSDVLGDIQPLHSNRIGPINSEPQGTLDISGTPTVGSTIYAIKNFSDADVDGQYWNSMISYQWLRNSYAIQGATGTLQNNGYVVQPEDYNNTLSVRATYTDNRGKTHVITSAGVSVTSNSPSGFYVSGTKEVNETLTAEITSIVDNDLVGERIFTSSQGDTVTVQNGKLYSGQVEYRWAIKNDDILNSNDLEIDSNGDYLIPNRGSIYKYDSYGNFKSLKSVGIIEQILLKDDYLYISQPNNHRIIRLDMTSSNLAYEFYAGSGNGSYNGNGSASLGTDFNKPVGFAFDASGRMYIADSENRRIRRLEANGLVSTYAGNPDTTSSYNQTIYLPGYSGDGVSAVDAKFALPHSLAFDSAGNLFVSDRDNHIVRKIDTTGVITNYAGIPEQSGSSEENSQATQFKLSYPRGIALDSSDNLYICDTNRLVKVDSSTLKATTFASGSNFNPNGILIKDDNIYVATGTFIKSIDSQGQGSDVYGFAEEEQELVSWGTGSSFHVGEDLYYKVVRAQIRYTDSYEVQKTATSDNRIQNSLPTGQPILSGVLGAGLPLTLYVNEIADKNMPSSSQENESWIFNYKFKSSERNPLGGNSNPQYIEGESGSVNGNETYVFTVPSDQYGSLITAEVRYVDGEGEEHLLTTSVSIPSLGLPKITGTTKQGYILNANLSEIENLQVGYEGQANPDISSVQWLRAENTSSALQEIVGATNFDYEVEGQDVDKYITFRATYTTNTGDLEVRFADASYIQNSVPTNPSIIASSSYYAGGYTVGDNLIINTSSVEDDNGIQAIYDVQWYSQKYAHDGRTSAGKENYESQDISGANSPVYTIRTEDQRKRIGARAILRDNLDNLHTIDTGYSYRRVDYEYSGFVDISGQPQIGETLTLSPNINDGDGYYQWPQSFTFKWFVNDSLIGGEGTDSYLIRYGDYNKTIRAIATYYDLANGDRRIISSSNSVYISQAAGTGFFISGNPRIGGTLEAITQFIDDPEGVNNAVYEIEWYANDVSTNNTSSIYNIEADDYGKIIRATVNYTDDLGNPESQEASVTIVNSSPTGSPKLVSIPNPADSGSVATLEIGGFYQLQLDNLFDADGPKDLSERDGWSFTRTLYWKGPRPEDDVEKVAATLVSGNVDYIDTIAQDDLGRTIYAKIEYTDGQGNNEAVYSTTLEIPPEEIQPEEVAQVLDTVPPESFGTGENVIELSSDHYEIIYDSSGENPIQDYIRLTAQVSSETEISYDFFVVEDGNNVILQKEFWDQDNTRLIAVPEQQFVSKTYGVAMYDADGTILSADYIIIYGI